MPHPPTARRSTPVTTGSQFVSLSLARLREYRATLLREEQRVSYWRRILQARIDVVEARAVTATGDVPTLAATLTRPRPQQGRRALLDLVPDLDVPPLPDLPALWAREPAPDDPARTGDLVGELRSAERSLSDYRQALHHHLALATAELIARYRVDPTLCFCALPTPRPRLDAALG